MCNSDCFHDVNILSGLFQSVTDGTRFTLLTVMASLLNTVQLGGKEGFCSPCPASSALVLVCAAPFTKRSFPFPQGTKGLAGGEASRVHRYGGRRGATKDWACRPAKTSWAEEGGPWQIQALELTEGETSSRVQRRF